ncbi:hypothetical protein [Roseivivax sp. CAU 1761]
MTEFEPGDLVEIRTARGLAYAQVTHRHPSYPPVVRALEGTHETRPDDLEALAAGPTRFVAMIPLAAALRQAGAECAAVARLDIPEDQRAFPTFRMPVRDKQGEVVYWWFWDGRGLSYDVELDARQQDLPMREVMSGARFLQLLERDAA